MGGERGIPPSTLFSVLIYKCNYIPLQIVHIPVGRSVIIHYSNTALCIIEEMQLVIPIRQMYNVLPVQYVFRRAGTGSRLLHPQSVFVVHKRNSFTIFARLCQLPSVLPSIGSGAEGQRVLDIQRPFLCYRL